MVKATASIRAGHASHPNNNNNPVIGLTANAPWNVLAICNATRSKARKPNWPSFAPPHWKAFTPPLTGCEYVNQYYVSFGLAYRYLILIVTKCYRDL